MKLQEIRKRALEGGRLARSELWTESFRLPDGTRGLVIYAPERPGEMRVRVGTDLREKMPRVAERIFSLAMLEAAGALPLSAGVEVPFRFGAVVREQGVVSVEAEGRFTRVRLRELPSGETEWTWTSLRKLR